MSLVGLVEVAQAPARFHRRSEKWDIRVELVFQVRLRLGVEWRSPNSIKTLRMPLFD